MYGLFIVLCDVNKLEPVVKKIRQIGVSSATIFDSVGAAQAKKLIKKSKSLLYSLIKSLEDDGTVKNKLIFSIVDSEEKVDQIMNQVEQIVGGDMKQPGSGIMFCVPILGKKGGDFDSTVD